MSTARPTQAKAKKIRYHERCVLPLHKSYEDWNKRVAEIEELETRLYALEVVPAQLQTPWRLCGRGSGWMGLLVEVAGLAGEIDGLLSMISDEEDLELKQRLACAWNKAMRLRDEVPIALLREVD